TAEHRPEVYLSGRNIPGVEVLRYAEASAHDLLRAEALVVEEAAVGGHAIARSKSAASTKEKRAQKAGRKPAGRAAAKHSAKAKSAAKKPVKKPAAKPAKKAKKGGGDD